MNANIGNGKLKLSSLAGGGVSGSPLGSSLSVGSVGAGKVKLSSLAGGGVPGSSLSVGSVGTGKVKLSSLAGGGVSGSSLSVGSVGTGKVKLSSLASSYQTGSGVSGQAASATEASGNKNRGGVLGGIGYLGHTLLQTTVANIEDWAIDAPFGFLFDLFGLDAVADAMTENSVMDPNAADEWYNPSEGWKTAAQAIQFVPQMVHTAREGAVQMTENAVDYVVSGALYGASEALDGTGAEGAADWAEEKAKLWLDDDLQDYEAADKIYGYDPQNPDWRKTPVDVASGIGTSLPNIAATVLVSYFTGNPTLGKWAGAVLTGLGAAGGAIKDAYREDGELSGEKYAYGALVGTSEMGIEAASNFIGVGGGRLANAFTKNKVASDAAKKISKPILNKVAKVLGDRVADFVSEGLEEGLSAHLEPIFARWTYNPDAESATIEEIAYEAWVGGLSGLIMGEAEAVISTARYHSAGKAAAESGSVDSILQAGKYFSELEAANDTGYENMRELTQTYEGLVKSLESTDGRVIKVSQKIALGKLQMLNAGVAIAPIFELSAKQSVMNAEAVAQRINAMGLKDADGNAFTITPEQITDGIDVTLANSKKSSDRKKFARQLRAQMAKNPILCTLASMDMAGKLMMDAREIEKLEAQGKSLASSVDLEKFRNETPEEIKKVLADELGISDWSEVTNESLEKIMAGYLSSPRSAEMIAQARRIAAAERAREEGQAYSPKVIKLKENSKLYREIVNSGRSASDVIREYIKKIFGGKTITFNDGRTAIVDNTDAKELAKKAGPMKVAEISQLKEIIDNAVLEQSDVKAEHKKFDSFTYYKATVKMGNKIQEILLNVGHGKFDNKNHLYAITDYSKKRNTAGHKDLAGPVGDLLQSGISDTIIPENAENVKTSDKKVLKNNAKQSKTPPPKKLPSRMADGIYIYTLESGEQFAIIKEGRLYRVYDYTTGDITTAMTKAQVNKFLSELSGGEIMSNIDLNGYQKATINEKILELLKKIKSNMFDQKERVYLNDISEEIANKIYVITGVDVTGFHVAIEARQLKHILNDHGVNGKADNSMSDDNDIAKMEYVLNHAESIVSAGKTKAYSYMKNGYNRTADTILYEKKVGEKSYYVVQAIPDTKAKTLFIVTAYIGKSSEQKGAPQLIDVSPDATSESVTAVTPNIIIPQSSEKSNTLGEKSFDKNPAYGENSKENSQAKNRVIAAQFASEEAIASTPHSPRFNGIISQRSDKSNTLGEKKFDNGEKSFDNKKGAPQLIDVSPDATSDNGSAVVPNDIISQDLDYINKKFPERDSIQNTDLDNGVYTDENIVQSFKIKSVNDYIGVQKAVIEALTDEGFFSNGNNIVTNLDSGMVVEITKDGIRETLGNGKRYERLPKDLKLLKLLTVRNLPQLIQKAYLDSSNKQNYHNPTSSVSYAYLVANTTLTLDNKLSEYSINIVIRQSPQKNKFWVHEIRTQKKSNNLSHSGEINPYQEYNEVATHEDIISQNSEKSNTHSEKSFDNKKGAPQLIDVSPDATSDNGSVVVPNDIIPQDLDYVDKKFPERDSIQNTDLDNGVYTDENIVQSFKIKSVNDYIGVQKAVIKALTDEGFFTNGNNIVINSESGMIVEITKKGIKETLGSGNRFQTLTRHQKLLKLMTIQDLPNLIKTAHLVIDNQNNYHNPNSELKYAYLSNNTTLKVDGKKSEFAVTITIRKSQQKNTFWIHEIRTTKKEQNLSHSEDGNLQQRYTKVSAHDDIVPQSSEKNNTLGEKNSAKSSERISEAKKRVQAAMHSSYAREHIRGYDKLSAEKREAVIETLRSAKESGVSDAVILASARLSARSGIVVEYNAEMFESYEKMGRGKVPAGIYLNGRIYINPRARRPYATLLIHEMQHAIFGADTERILFSIADKMTSESEKRAIEERYGIDRHVDGEEFADELTSYYAKRVLGTQKGLEYVLGIKPSLKEKILAFFGKAAQDYSYDKHLCEAARAFARKYKEMFDKISDGRAEDYETRKKRFSIIPNDVTQSESLAVVQLLHDNIEKIPDTEVFDVHYDVSVEEYSKKSEYIMEIFSEQGKIAYNKQIGVVELVQSGAKSTVMHGYGNTKLAAITAIKPTIEHGIIISYTENYKNSGVDRYVIASKGKIDNKPAYIGVVIKSYPRTKNNSKFYLHEAEIIETDVSFMTAPQLSVDTVNTSASNNRIAQNPDSVKKKFSEREISKSDIDALMTIPRKSINAFTSEEIKKTEAWAKKFYAELGAKSPFFRAWFGDWREYEQNKIDVIVANPDSALKSGKTANSDTDKVISWSAHHIHGESLNHAVKDKVALEALNQIEDVVKKAVLLDTVVSLPSSKSKMPNTAFMHSFYAIYENASGQYLLKLYVEEALSNKGNEVFSRAYELKDIEKVADIQSGIHSQKRGLTTDKSATINSISDLYKYVKSHDKDFSPKKANPAFLNEDGTPKVFHFVTENSEEGMSGLTWSRGVRLFADRSVAQKYGGEIMPMYVSGASDHVNRAPRTVGESDAMVYSPVQIKSADENIGTFDGSNEDIRYAYDDNNIITKRTIKIEHQKEGLSQVNPQLHKSLSIFNENPSKNIILQNSEINNTFDEKNISSDVANDKKGRLAYDDADTDGVDVGEGKYSYAHLTSKPDMIVVGLRDSVPTDNDGKILRGEVRRIGIENARSQNNPNNNEKETYVYVRDIGKHVRINRDGLEHGLTRSANDTALAVMCIGDILTNAVAVNELSSRVTNKKSTDMSYVLLGMGQNKSGTYLVRVIVDKNSNAVSEISSYGLYAVKAKKEGAIFTLKSDEGVEAEASVPYLGSGISISDFLTRVKGIELANSVLSDDVLSNLDAVRGRDEFGSSIRYAHDEELDGADIGVKSEKRSQGVSADKVTVSKGRHAAMRANNLGEKVFTKKTIQSAIIGIKEMKYVPADVRSELIDSLWKGYNDRLNAEGYDIYSELSYERIRATILQESGFEMSRAEIAEMDSHIEGALLNILEQARLSVRSKLRVGVEAEKAELQKKALQIQKDRESFKKKRTKESFFRSYNRLLTRLLKPTKEKNIQEGMQRAFADALLQMDINLETLSRIEELESKIEKMRREDVPRAKKLAELEAQRDRLAENRAGVYGYMRSLKKAYDGFEKSSDPNVRGAYDEVISQKLQEYVDAVGNTPLSEMSLGQLTAASRFVRELLRIANNSNRLFAQEKQQRASEMSEAIMREASGSDILKILKPKTVSGKASVFAKDFMWNNLKPPHFFDMLGSPTLTSLYESLHKGELVWVNDVYEAKEFFNKTAKKYHFDTWEQDATFDFVSTGGKKFSLNLGQIMALYAWSKRTQALEHLRVGGFKFQPDSKAAKKLGFERYLNDAQTYTVSSELLTQIQKKLSDEQRAFVDEMQGYLSEDMAQKGNEVSVALYGIKIFKEKNYFPMLCSDAFLESNTGGVQGDPKIKNKGMTKPVVPRANNPLILGDFLDIWSRHVNDMAQYHGMVLPCEDINKVLNYIPSVEQEGTANSEQNKRGKSNTGGGKNLNISPLDENASADIVHHDGKKVNTKSGNDTAVKKDEGISARGRQDGVAQQYRPSSLREKITEEDTGIGVAKATRSNTDGVIVEEVIDTNVARRLAHPTADEVAAARRSNEKTSQRAPSLGISIAQLFKNINPSDESFYKYIPKEFFSAEETQGAKDTRTPGYTSLKQVLSEEYGASVVKYIEKLLVDINGGVRAYNSLRGPDAMLSNFKKISTMASASVIIQQPSSLPRAMAYIDPKYFIGLVKVNNHKARWEEIKRYAPVAKLKELGGFDTGTGRNTASFIQSVEYRGKDKVKGILTDKDYRDDMLGRGAAFADEITWVQIWEACCREQIDIYNRGVDERNAKRDNVIDSDKKGAVTQVLDTKNSSSVGKSLTSPAPGENIQQREGKVKAGSKENSEAPGYINRQSLKDNPELMRKVAERFDYIITRTQVYDSVLSRSAHMRSSDGLSKMATAFMAEPTTVVSMLFVSAQKFARGEKGAARIIGSVVAATILNSILASFVYAARDDDEEKSYIEKYISAFIGQLGDSFNPLGMFPILRDFASIFDGYEVERSDMAPIADLYKAYEALLPKGENDGVTFDEVMTFVANVGSIFGVPTRNMYRDAKAFFNTVRSVFVGERTTARGVSVAFRESVLGRLGWKTSNGQELYDALISGDSKHYDRVMARFEDKDEAMAQLKVALRDNDTRIEAAARAKLEGDTALYNSTVEQIYKEGNFTRAFVISAVNAEYNEMRRELEETGRVIFSGDMMYSLSEEQVSALSAARERLSSDLESMKNSRSYLSLSSELQQVADSYAEDLVFDAAQAAIGVVEDKASVLVSVVGIGNVSVLYARLKGVESDVDRYGESIAGSMRSKVLAAINALGVSPAKRLILICSRGYSIKDGDIPGLSAQQAKRMLKGYIASLKVSNEQKVYLLEMCGLDAMSVWKAVRSEKGA